jgi:hypothetical protein
LDGKRPIRDYIAERYLKELEEKDAHSLKSSGSEDETDTQFKLQQLKFKKMQAKQKREMQQQRELS